MSSSADTEVTGSLGLATGDLPALRQRTLAAWDGFLDVARDADLQAPSRLRGWRGVDVAIHLGAWGESALEAVVSSARAGAPGPPLDPDRANAELLALHRRVSPDEALDAVVRARDGVAAFFNSTVESQLGRRAAQSMVGPLPVLTIVHAASYELAVHALDLGPCGAPAPAAGLLDAGVAALVDVTGALASRTGRTAAVTVMTPAGGWRGAVPVRGGGWVTERVAAGPVRGTAVFGTATDLLDASAGRVVIPRLLVTGRIRIHDVPGLLRLAPIVTEIPGIPGGPALRIASRALAGAGGALSLLPRLPGLRRRDERGGQ